MNKLFEEHYTGEEEVVLGNNEHYLEQQDSEEYKRITDSHFMIRGRVKTGRYHTVDQLFEKKTGGA